MTRKIVTYNAILKRSRCLNSPITESTKVDSQKIFNNLNRSIEIRKNGRNADTQQLLRSYIESMCNYDNASRYYRQIFELLENFNEVDPVVSDRILTEFTNRILPYVEDTDGVITALNNSNITNEQADTIYSEASMYSVADRMIKNHEQISKRFNIERECNRIRTAGLKYFIDSCADMIDTYKLKEYQKMNLVFEECFYLLEKNGIEYDKQDMIKYVVEYFLVQNPYISNTELNNFKRAINENYIFCEQDIKEVNSLLSSNVSEDEPYKSIEDGIHRFLVSCTKNEDSICKMVSRVMSETNKQDIIYNIENLIYLFWDLIKNKTLDKDDGIYKAMKIIDSFIAGSTMIISNNSANTEYFTREDLDIIINKLNNIKGEILLIGNSNNMYSSSATAFCKELNGLISRLTDTSTLLSSKPNIDAIAAVNNRDVESVPLKEFKIFKFHNLVNAAFNLNKFLKVKEKKLINSSKKVVNKFVSKTKHILFGESKEFTDNILSYIGEDSKASICVRQYPYDESELPELTKYLDTVCIEYNDLLLSQNMDTVKVYYNINPGIAEICIKEAAIVDLTEAEYDTAMRTFDNSIDIYLETFVETSNSFSMYDGFVSTPLEEQLLDFTKFDNFTYEHFEAALEALSYLDIDDSIVKIFGEKFSDYQFNKAIQEGIINESYEGLSKQEKLVSEAVEAWEKYIDVPANIQLEAYGYLLDIIEEASKRPPVVGGKAIDQKLKAKGYYNSEDDDDEEDEKPVKKVVDKKIASNTSKEFDHEKHQAEYNNYYSKQKEKKSFLNLNDIKLGLMGLRQKFKDMSNKEKELSRNLDNSVRSVVNGMKQSMSSNRREAIIKGSIIPSFSNCIKTAIGLAGLGIITNGVVVPIIVAVGGLAVSKKLNDKERALLLDEIETELEVVDKEISIAESNNKIKKYRALLRYKKELQRQYQRIRYNLKIGKNLIPSSVGMFKKDDD